MANAETKMIPLLNQEQFEKLISKGPLIKKDPIAIILFSASWCGPCKRLDKDVLIGLSDKIMWYKCDVDENNYTPGFCGVRGIPAFMAIVNGKPQPLFQSSDTQKVTEWMKGQGI